MTHAKNLPRPLGLAAGAAMLATFAALAPAPALAQHHRCGPAVEKHLGSLGLQAKAIEHTEIIAIVPNREFGSPSEYQAWTALKSCSGSLVTRLTTSCRVKESYSRGDCRVPGAKP